MEKKKKPERKTNRKKIKKNRKVKNTFSKVITIHILHS